MQPRPGLGEKSNVHSDAPPGLIAFSRTMTGGLHRRLISISPPGFNRAVLVNAESEVTRYVRGQRPRLQQAKQARFPDPRS
jgi:hypothetical protein